MVLSECKKGLLQTGSGDLEVREPGVAQEQLAHDGLGSLYL
jgi:hypothetical protein